MAAKARSNLNLNDNGTEIQSQIANLTKTGLTVLLKSHISKLSTMKEGLKQT